MKRLLILQVLCSGCAEPKKYNFRFILYCQMALFTFSMRCVSCSSHDGCIVRFPHSPYSPSGTDFNISWGLQKCHHKRLVLVFSFAYHQSDIFWSGFMTLNANTEKYFKLQCCFYFGPNCTSVLPIKFYCSLCKTSLNF